METFANIRTLFGMLGSVLCLYEGRFLKLTAYSLAHDIIGQKFKDKPV